MKRHEICARTWCQKLCAILFLATFSLWKDKIIKYFLLFDSGILLTEMGALVGWILMSIGFCMKGHIAAISPFMRPLIGTDIAFKSISITKYFALCVVEGQLCSCYMSQWLTVEWIGFQIVIKQRRRNRKKRELLFWSYCAEKKLHTHAMERDNKT